MAEVKLSPEKTVKPVRPLSTLTRRKAVPHPGWGGAREGAGRKPRGDVKLDATVMVRLTPEQKRVFRRKGGSAWLRAVLDGCMSQDPEKLADPERPTPFGDLSDEEVRRLLAEKD